MKFNKVLSIAILMNLSPIALMAKPVSGFPVIATEAGQYNFESTDIHSILSTVSSQMSQRELKQIEILQDAIKDLESKYKILITSDLQTIRSAATGGHKKFKREDGSFDQLYSKFDNLSNARKLFAISIKNLKSIPLSISGSEEISISGKNIQYPSFINKNAFDSMVSNFEAQLNEVNSQLSSLNFKIETSEDALEFISFDELESYRAKLFFSTGELEQMRADANRMRARMSKDERAIDSTLNKKIMTEIQTFINLWGHERSFQVAEFNESQFTENLEDIQRYFYIRSALRIMYKIPIGTYSFKHVKKAFNLDVLRADSDLVTFNANPIRSTEDIKRSKDAVINALAILEMRTSTQRPNTDVQARELGAQITDIFSGDASIMQKLMNARTILTGNMPLAQVNKEVLKLLLADLQEEQLMNEFGGEAKVKIAHKERYQEERFKTAKEGLIQIVSGKNRKKLDTNSVEGTLAIVNSSLKNMNAKISEANILEEKIARMEAQTERGQDGFSVDLDF